MSAEPSKSNENIQFMDLSSSQSESLMKSFLCPISNVNMIP
jgi:hypothetical protein